MVHCFRPEGELSDSMASDAAIGLQREVGPYVGVTPRVDYFRMARHSGAIRKVPRKRS